MSSAERLDKSIGMVVDGDGWEWRSMMIDKEEMDG
jgi:hypothetical protein